MNYLAHFYLSNYDDNLIIGNYIADDVKGKAYLKYPEKIQQGILLHRRIDDFTDSHNQVFISKNRIREHQRKYTPVVMDVFYDYYLAKHWNDYASQPLKEFTHHVYKTLFKNIAQLPLKSQMRLSFMSKSNWLYSYKEITGIQKALTGLSKRTTFENNMHNAHHLLVKNEMVLKEDFELFFPELQEHVQSEIKNYSNH
jgi:acyl carrier protein phosphodiesterase